MAKFCLGCTKVDAFQWNGKCLYCNSSYYAYLCTDCPLLAPGANRQCEDCEEARKQRKISEENKVFPLPPSPRKRTGAVRLPDKFTGKVKSPRPDKFYYEKRDKRHNQVAKDKQRNIKYQFYERHDLGEMDRKGEFSYENRFGTFSGRFKFGLVPLTKQERENAKRTNGHLVHDSCKCEEFMWKTNYPRLKCGKLVTKSTCAFCPRHYKLDKHGQPEFDYVEDELYMWG
jgi:hypothetical protein